MKDRYRLVRRGGVFYAHDRQTLLRTSLQTNDRARAKRLLQAKNESFVQPLVNGAIAKVYLAAQDPALVQRTWGEVMASYSIRGKESTQDRTRRAFASKPFQRLNYLKLVETTSAHFEGVLKAGGSSTNNYLRRIHNMALRKGWLIQSIINLADWPRTTPQSRRAITAEEHARILASENDQERVAYYSMLWETGGAQSDIAELSRENVDAKQGMLVFHRKKTGEKCQLKLSTSACELIEKLPPAGPFFPKLRRIEAKHRASEFRRRCNILKLTGITLHSYRYSWAERACAVGYPERFAQAALGHKSRAVHRAYARNADFICPSLSEFGLKFR